MIRQPSERIEGGFQNMIYSHQSIEGGFQNIFTGEFQGNFRI